MISERRARLCLNRRAVQRGAVTGGADPAFRQGRLIDDAEERIAAISEADQVGEDWNAVQERLRAVDRIEHPDVVCIHLRIAVFLATDPVVGISGFDHLPLRRLDFTVGDGDGRFVRFGLD